MNGDRQRQSYPGQQRVLPRVTGLLPTPDDEIDFTGAFRSAARMRQSLSNESRNDSARTSFAMDSQSRDPCGFCRDSQNCVCYPSPESTLPEGAGNCSACADDPVRQAACRGLAERAQRPSSDARGPTLGCAQFMNEVRFFRYLLQSFILSVLDVTVRIVPDCFIRKLC